MTHLMEITSTSGDGWTLECGACGRVVILRRDGGPDGMIVVDRGDVTASHTVATPGVSLVAGLA